VQPYHLTTIQSYSKPLRISCPLYVERNDLSKLVHTPTPMALNTVADVVVLLDNLELGSLKPAFVANGICGEWGGGGDTRCLACWCSREAP